eukprot:SAG11_NODE_2175_length_3718_cov_3.873169_2_plen_84_part_00
MPHAISGITVTDATPLQLIVNLWGKNGQDLATGNRPIHKLAKFSYLGKFILEGSRRYLLDSCTNIQYEPPGRTVLVQVLFCTV